MADYRVFWAGNGYTIERPDGRIARGRWGSKAQAETRVTNLEREDRATLDRTRPCITCRTPFQSEGPHNRMCTQCRTRQADAPYQIGHRRGRIGAKA